VKALEVVALIAGAIAALLAVWATLLPLIAWFSGWRRLAEEFRADPKSRGRIVLASATLRYGAHYGGVILLDASSDGLVLSVRRPFRLAHPPLLIPWAQVAAEPTTVLGLFPATCLKLGGDAQIPLTLYNREARDRVAEFIQTAQQPEVR
jgi:hypothetical protein